MFVAKLRSEQRRELEVAPLHEWIVLRERRDRQISLASGREDQPRVEARRQWEPDVPTALPKVAEGRDEAPLQCVQCNLVGRWLLHASERRAR
jgi:hypothetical protein